MPGIVALVSQISDHVVAALAAAGLPPLTDGKILLGRQHQREQSAPPRIIFIPAASTFGTRDTYNGQVFQGGDYSPEALLQNTENAVGSDYKTFEVRCWGSSVPPDPDSDFDFTELLYQQVFASCDALARGTFQFGPGAWTDAELTNSQLIRDGREFVFALTIGTPILDKLLPFALKTGRDVQNPPVKANPNTNMELPDGSTEVGCSG